MICPNCGGEASSSFCPFCGSKLGGEENHGRRAHNQNAATAQSGAEPMGTDWIKRDRAEYAAGKTVGESPLVKFLRELASSPLILISAILMTVYTGVACYACGLRGIQSLNVLSDQRYFDSAISLGKLNYIAVLAPCVTKLMLSVWLMVSLWSLYSAALAGKRKGLSYNAADSLKAYSNAGALVFKLLTAVSLVSLAYAAFLKLSNADSLPDSVRQILNALAQLTYESADRAERQQLAAWISNEALVHLSLFSLTFILRIICFSMLHKLCIVFSNMIRYGETTVHRFSALAPLTLLSGLLTIANAAVWLLTTRISNDALMLYAPAFAYGLVLVCSAVVLYRFNAGLNRA